MAHRISPNIVKTVTKEGEVELIIKLELNINLNTDNITIQSQTEGVTDEKKQKEDDFKWEIPEFSSEKVNFGK